jgi:iron complex outermembrane receptor protein
MGIWHMNINRRRLACVPALTLCVLAPVHADMTPAAASDPTADSSGLEEIVVTAQRRSESLERTPVAVTVIGSDALQRQDIVTEADLRTAVPGLTVRASLNSNDLNYSIRGQTVDAFSGSQPAVLPYINEVQVGSSGGASAFYDLQSVQVLKGPQGTLFGKNSTGGAVLFTTAKPTSDFGGYFSASTGNYGLAQFEGAINIPLNDAVQARVAGFYESRNGFQYNTFTGGYGGEVLRDGVRATLAVKFSDSVKTQLVVDYFHAGGTSTNLVLSAVAAPGSNGAFVPANVFYTPALDTIFGPGAFAAFSAGNPRIPAGGIFAFLALQNARGPFVTSDNIGDAHKANNIVTSNITTVDFASDLQFKNIVGFNKLVSSDGDDADGSPYGILGTVPGNDYGIFKTLEQFSEEPQLIGKTLGDKLSYVTGLYYSYQRLNDRDETSFLDLSPLPVPLTVQHADTVSRDASYAGYGQGTYDLSDATHVQGLSATAGIRYTKEEVSMEQLPSSTSYGLPPPFQNYLSKNFDKVSWQIGVQEQLNNDLLLYVVSRRSFRSGGFNNTAPPIPGFGNEGGAGFDAETATDVELGAKYQGSVFGLPSRLNVAVYDESIKNIQRAAYTVVAGQIAAVTTNVPKTRVSGLQVDGQINPATWLRLGTNFTYTDAKFTSNQVSLPGPPPITVGFGPYPDTPTWSGTVFSEVTLPVTADIAVSARGELYDQTKIYYSSTYNTLTPDTAISGYAVTNFRLSVDDSKAGWSVAANVKNAFNRVYYVGGLAAINVITTNAVIPGDPRTFSVTLRYNF